MNDDDDIELTEEQARALRDLRRGPEPPEALEERTVSRLRELGELGTKRTRPFRAPLVAAASFTVGVLAGTFLHTTPEPRYILLLTEESQTSPSGEGDDRVAEYAQWARDVRDGGVGISGARLAGELEVIGASTRSPAVSGFFLLDVDGDAEALAIARSCPHTRYGGSVILGRIVR